MSGVYGSKITVTKGKMQLLVILAFDELFYDVLNTNEHPFDEKKMGTIVRKFRRFTLTVFLPTIFSLRLHFYYRVDLTNFFFPRCDNHTMPCIYAHSVEKYNKTRSQFLGKNQHFLPSNQRFTKEVTEDSSFHGIF